MQRHSASAGEMREVERTPLRSVRGLMKIPKLLSLLLGALFVLTLALTGCGTETVITLNPIPVEDGKGDTTWDKETTTANLAVAPYFANGDISYFQVTQLTHPSFAETHKDEIVNLYNIAMGNAGFTDPTSQATAWEELSSSFQWYAIGTITADNDYKDDTLVVLDLPCDGPCFEPMLYRFAWDENTGDFTWLSSHSAQGIMDYLNPIITNTDDTLVLNGLDAPAEITLPDGVNKITLGSNSHGYFPDTVPGSLAFEDSNIGKVYFGYDVANAETAWTACLFLQLPDGSIARYEYNP